MASTICIALVQRVTGQVVGHAAQPDALRLEIGEDLGQQSTPVDDFHLFNGTVIIARIPSDTNESR